MSDVERLRKAEAERMLYRKRNGRYVPVGQETLLHAPGVWLVTKGEHFKGQRHIAFLGEVRDVHSFAQMQQHAEKAAAAVVALREKAYSAADLVDVVLKAIQQSMEAKAPPVQTW